MACIFCLGSLAFSLSPNPHLLALSRILLGFAVGGSSQVTPMYIAELAPPSRRGRLVISFNLSIGVGILVANIVGFTLLDIWTWRWMIAVAIFPAIILFLCMLRLPESPRWLAENISMDRARAVLERSGKRAPTSPSSSTKSGKLWRKAAAAKKPVGACCWSPGFARLPSPLLALRPSRNLAAWRR